MHMQRKTRGFSKVLLWFALLHLSACEPSTPTPLNGPTLDSSTASILEASPFAPATTNLTASNGASNSNCAAPQNWPSWYSPNWLVEDCYAALQRLYMQETMAHKTQRFEFLAPGASQTLTKLPTQKTPRKYIVSTQFLHQRDMVLSGEADFKKTLVF